MQYPKASKEIAKVVAGVTTYLCLFATLITVLYKMFVTDWYYRREIFLAMLFVVTFNVILFKVLKPLIESVLQLLEGVDVFMKSKLENYFEARDYYIIKHGEYQAGLYFSKRPEGPLQLWEFAFEKRILEVNSNFDRSRIKHETAEMNRHL